MFTQIQNRFPGRFIHFDVWFVSYKPTDVFIVLAFDQI
jgi:hypothetical protein